MISFAYYGMEYLERIKSLRSIQELLSTLVLIAEDLEFDYAAYGIRVPIPITRPQVAMISNYPDTWASTYMRNQYFNMDPTVEHALKSCNFVLWNEELFRNSPNFWEEARSYGLSYGISQPVHGRNSVGLITLSREYGTISDAELEHRLPLIALLSTTIHMSVSECMLPQSEPERKHQLTDREVDVLRWTAEGKSASDISQILNIAERTVNFHIGNSMHKLDVQNKTAAAVRAALLGMI